MSAVFKISSAASYPPLEQSPSSFLPPARVVGMHLTTIEQSSSGWSRNPLGSQSFAANLPGRRSVDGGPYEPGPSGRMYPYCQSDQSRMTTQDIRQLPLWGHHGVTIQTPSAHVASQVKATRKVTADDLRLLRTWGKNGITERGGLSNVANQLGVKYGTLTSLINVHGQPSPTGLRKLGEEIARPITAEDLGQLRKWGQGGIAKRGGLPAVAKQLGVSYGTLVRLTNSCGEPTPAGQRLLNQTKPVPITVETLRHVLKLGRSGIDAQGGLPALARQLGVAYSSLARLVNPRGQATRTGLYKLGEAKCKRIAADDLRQVVAGGKKGIDAQGGLAVIADRLGVTYSSLYKLVDPNGQPTPTGLRKLGQVVIKPVTAEHLRQIRAWGEAGIAFRGGLTAIAGQLGVCYSTLYALIDAQGQPTVAGLCKLGEASIRRITKQDLLQLHAWGQGGIDARGGLSVIADQFGVSLISLRRLINAQGQLTKAGLHRLSGRTH
jgi:DNA-binding phage protein